MDPTEQTHWNEFQGSAYVWRRRMKEREADWSDYRDPAEQSAALRAFLRYAMQLDEEIPALRGVDWPLSRDDLLSLFCHCLESLCR